MKIPLSIKNHPRIEAALSACNGRASAHTYSLKTLLHEAAMAEHTLHDLGLTKAQRIGAKLFALSGSKLPHAYKYQIRANMARMVRASTGWTLTELTLGDVWGGGQSTLTLTQAQDVQAVNRLRRKYSVLVS